MARSEKKSKATKTDAPLKDGVAAFMRGDFVTARKLLVPKETDSSLSNAEQTQAKDLVVATRIERGALYTGLACIGLLLLVIAFAHFIQPG